MSNSNNVSNDGVVTINIQPFLLPVSIILSAVILASGLVISMNNLGNLLKGTAGNTTTATVPTNTNTPPTNAAAPASGSTTIDDDPYLGDRSTAKLAIVEFSDYECPFCQRHFQQTYSEIKTNYVDTGKLIYVFRDYPLSFHEPAASREANSANCALSLGDTNKFFQMHDYIFTNTPSNGTGIDQTVLSEYAGSIGIDRTAFDSCVSSETFKAEIQNDTDSGALAGVSGTPGFIIGTLAADGTVTGNIISGAQPYSSFQTVIESLLAQ
jgi:protein-disulfide isomerase